MPRSARTIPTRDIHSDKRDNVCVAAIRVFIEDGYRASMDKIAAEAGVAKQTLYNQFGSKERLFADVIRQSVDTITLTLEEPGLNLRAARLHRLALRLLVPGR